LGRAGLRRGAAIVLAAGLLLAVASLLAAGCADGGSTGSEPALTAAEAGSPSGLSASERAEIAVTLRAFRSDGPFPHEQDGGTFFNREGLLPDRPAGHYREYTVETPGSDDRGARRLVIGAEGETYYTRDHYSSFIEIDPDDFP
jgi:ribonuclease T1